MSAHATTRHYSQEVALFEGFLDGYMKYSSGLWTTWDEPLDVAILRMLDRICDWGQVRDGARVLEIGNGWGSLLRRLRERTSGLDYTGVNPSAVQLDWIRAHVADTGHLVEAPFEAVMHDLVGPYDTIFMIGSLCHMRDKAEVLARVAALLAPTGRLVLEDTFFLSEAHYQAHHARPETRFVQDDVFGYAHVHSLARHMDEVRAAGLHVVQLLANADHYARTIEIWTERLSRLPPDRFPLARTFIQYMDVFQRGWNHTIGNHLMALERLPERRRARVPLPL